MHAAEETTDQVFLLSLAEAKQYFANNAARVAHPTDYAVKQGVYVGVASNDEQPDGAAAWWLRSNGYYAGYGSELKSTLGGNIGVRPAIWVETSALS